MHALAEDFGCSEMY